MGSLKSSGISRGGYCPLYGIGGVNKAVWHVVLRSRAFQAWLICDACCNLGRVRLCCLQVMCSRRRRRAVFLWSYGGLVDEVRVSLLVFCVLV